MNDYDKYTGMDFGMLTVLSVFRDSEGALKCRCRCECQELTEVYLSNLKSGRTRSCGCQEKANRRKFKDITGQRFGKLTAISPTEKRKGGSVVWKCECDCGNIYYQSERNLVRKFSKHCGCKKRSMENPDFRDLTDQRFNRLTALYPTEKRTSGGSVIWHCICDCEKEVDVSETALVHGGQVSCGCRVSEVGKELTTHLHFVDGTCVEFLKRKQRSDNTSGYTGVYKTKNGKYRAGITFKQTRYYLGTYDTFEEAKQIRQAAEKQYHQSFVTSYEKKNSEGNQDAVQRAYPADFVHPYSSGFRIS